MNALNLLLPLSLALIWIGEAQALPLYKCADDKGGIKWTTRAYAAGNPQCKAVAEEPVRLKECSNACSIKLFRAADGSFTAYGFIGTAKTKFIVDTGASWVTIGGAKAKAAGVQGVKAAKFKTAAGTIEGQLSGLTSVAVEGLPVAQLAVAINPDLDNNIALLGQNFLRHFKITMQGDVMEISTK